jgi:hypothetical protein
VTLTDEPNSAFDTVTPEAVMALAELIAAAVSVPLTDSEADDTDPDEVIPVVVKSLPIRMDDAVTDPAVSAPETSAAGDCIIVVAVKLSTNTVAPAVRPVAVRAPVERVPDCRNPVTLTADPVSGAEDDRPTTFNKPLITPVVPVNGPVVLSEPTRAKLVTVSESTVAAPLALNVATLSAVAVSDAVDTDPEATDVAVTAPVDTPAAVRGPALMPVAVSSAAVRGPEDRDANALAVAVRVGVVIEPAVSAPLMVAAAPLIKVLTVKLGVPIEVDAVTEAAVTMPEEEMLAA